jgi:tetratricopeptide (TPR) repeat protein
MVLALVTLFLTSFAYRATVPASGQAKPQAKGKGPMAAIPALMAKLQENPRDGKTILDLAEAFMRGRDWQRAEHFYGQAIALDPKNAGAYYHRAIASLELKKFQEALADFESLLAIKPDVAETHYSIGMLYKYELKNPQSAKEHLQKALDLKPADKEFLAELEKELKTP